MTQKYDRVLAFHVILSTYGFWLPNDPRGSCSTEVRAPNLRPFGPATTVHTHRSVAGKPHDRAARLAAKRALTYPPVELNGLQARSVALGFGAVAAKSGYRIHACAILPRHAHLVVARHRYPIEQVVRLLRQAATLRLLDDGLHPFADRRTAEGRLPSVWGQDFWKRFLYRDEEVRDRIAYVEANPLKEGKRRQCWSFVTPYTPEHDRG
jgi:REP element-mobilizing transposase RayT